MHARQPCLNSISRRTRSQWDSFYKNRHDEIQKKNKPDQDSVTNIGECTAKYNGKNKEFEIKKESFVKKGVGKKADPITIDDSEDSTTAEDSDDSENNTSSDDAYEIRNKKTGRPRKKKARVSEEVDWIDMLLDSRCKEKDLLKVNHVSVKQIAPSQGILPLKFKFEDDQESCLTEKTDWEKEIDSLFGDLEMGLLESEIGCTNFSMSDDECTISRDNVESPAARCGRGEHDVVLDEQIGVYVKPPGRNQRISWEEFQNSNIMNKFQFEGSACGSNLESSFHYNGTILDLIPDSHKQLYPHQLEGLEFLWRNIAGNIHINKLEKLPADGGRGCIISHAPGTGKTRLTIVFLQTFLKLYPTCRPVIMAPSGMLLTWEQEFKKWNVDINFHNLNDPKLSSQEAAIAASVVDQTRGHEKNKDYARFIKLHSWMKGGSVLGISYRLFEELAGEHNNKRHYCNDKFKKILVELPGLLVMDEGHNPRNNQSQTWNALTMVKTRRRVILSGTPFQNNFSELYNTLCLVDRRFSNQIMKSGRERKNSGRKRRKFNNAARDEWANLTSSIINGGDDGLKKLRSIIEPFVHIHKGDILQKTLPGIRDCLVVLKPTDLQKQLLQNISQTDKFLEQAYVASLISVHPALVAKRPEFSDQKRNLKLLESDPNAGVKTKFLVNLIKQSARIHEKVLVFSQFLDPLIHIKNLLKRHFSWKEGRELIYMDGDLDINQRQRLINSFNDKRSEAKVLLASQKACSEGINLVGASRVVLLDVVWNPSVERQAICRAYRLGQTKVVYVYHLVTSAEVKKYARQAEKERLSELIFCPAGKTDPCNQAVEEDEVLENIVGDQSIGCMIERIVHQPKESDFVNNFGFVDLS
ncbi:hypothetical protein DH2020_009515 [Rehmannia glutinosa]|uniref:SNF2 domain-containing protein n=1 Tax=Rehmannia glutinosa TaxID=99300 RepID=A0ABR0X6J3_REHGL